jgi:hypothetical protein
MNGVDAEFRIDPLPASATGARDYEFKGDAGARVLAERTKVWPLVRLRALLYFLTLLATAVIVIFPLTGRSSVLAEKENVLKWLSEIIRAAAGFLPGWASSWVIA